MDDVAGDAGRGWYGPGQVQIQGLTLSFALRGNPAEALIPPPELPPPPTEPDYELMRRSDARAAITYAEALETAIASVAPGAKWRVNSRLDPPDTAGPGIGLPELVHLIVGDNPIERGASYLAYAAALKKGIAWLKQRGKAPIYLDDGAAWLLALEAVGMATNAEDIENVFATPIRSSATDDYYATPRGYLFGFKADGRALTVAVGIHGTVGRVQAMEASGLDADAPPPRPTPETR